MAMDNIVYVATDEVNVHKFNCTADGDRPVLEVYVIDTPGQEKLPIMIAPINSTPAQRQETLGLTHAVTETITDPSGAPIGLSRKICVNCIATYIAPRAATMMARVYIPKVTTS